MALARDFARLSPKDRARTLVLDPTRPGRQQLTDAIRAEPRRDGTLGDRAMVATVLKSCGLTDAQRTHAASYRPGTIVLVRSNDDETGLPRDIGCRVVGRFERGTSRPGGDTLKRLADALDTTSDYLLDGASDDAAAARVTDRELLRQFQAVEHLPDADKQVVKTLLDAFIAKRQIESIIR